MGNTVSSSKIEKKPLVTINILVEDYIIITTEISARTRMMTILMVMMYDNINNWGQNGLRSSRPKSCCPKPESRCPKFISVSPDMLSDVARNFSMLKKILKMLKS